MKKLTPADYLHMPWKNGAGTTIEIAVFPPGAQLHDFVWRVSRAQVVCDGSFSHFDGIERTLALLQGEGMRLNVDGKPMQVDAQQPVISFAGDAEIHAELLNGPIGDFNLMSRRSRATHQLHRWTGVTELSLPQATVLLYCAQGSGSVQQGTQHLPLQTDEAVLLSASPLPTTLQSNADSVFYAVQINLNA